MDENVEVVEVGNVEMVDVGNVTEVMQNVNAKNLDDENAISVVSEIVVKEEDKNPTKKASTSKVWMHFTKKRNKSW